MRSPEVLRVKIEVQQAHLNRLDIDRRTAIELKGRIDALHYALGDQEDLPYPDW
jgi:hypothetical protein